MRRGFTLVEILQVIAIIGILSAITLPALARARELARRASCAANLMQWGMALRMYADEHGRQFPWSGGADNADCLIPFHRNYLPSLGSFACPSSSVAYSDYVDGIGKVPNAYLGADLSLRGSYDYLGAYTEAPLSLPHPTRAPERLPLAWDLVSDGGYPFEELVDAGGSLNPGEGRRSGGGLSALAGPGRGRYKILRVAHPVPKRREYSSYGNHTNRWAGLDRGGGNVLWMDGSVTFVSVRDWAGPNLPLRLDHIAMFNPNLGGRKPYFLPHEIAARDAPPEYTDVRPPPVAYNTAPVLSAYFGMGRDRRGPPEPEPGPLTKVWLWIKYNILVWDP